MTDIDQHKWDGLEAHPRKMADTPKTLPWTDKVCHFVRFGRGPAAHESPQLGHRKSDDQQLFDNLMQTENSRGNEVARSWQFRRWRIRQSQLVTSGLDRRYPFA
ncbi:MAG: hypothetical protein JWP89_4340 [Schlesneria sp.]|nr:hypothetical protein [Schlesneria sp.]